MVKIMDIHNCSLDPSRYPKKAKHNKMVEELRDTHPGCFWNRTLSKKGRGVKILELLVNP
jgi:hypothetical protein